MYISEEDQKKIISAYNNFYKTVVYESSKKLSGNELKAIGQEIFDDFMEKALEERGFSAAEK